MQHTFDLQALSCASNMFDMHVETPDHQDALHSWHRGGERKLPLSFPLRPQYSRNMRDRSQVHWGYPAFP